MAPRTANAKARAMVPRPLVPRPRQAQPDITSQIAQLNAMGFDDKVARAALSKHAWDVNQALDWLLTCLQMEIIEAKAVVETTDVVNVKAVVGTTDVIDVVPEQQPASASKCSPRNKVDSKFEDRQASVAREQVPVAPDEVRTSQDELRNDPDNARSTPEEVHDASNDSHFSQTTDCERVLGAQSTVLEVAVGAGFDSLPVSGATSQAAGEASEAACPIVRHLQPKMPDDVTSAPVAAESSRRVLRAGRSWLADPSSGVLGVEQGMFVRAWTNTRTEQGWIYAEVEDSPDREGWIPSVILADVPVDCEWKRAVCTWNGGSTSHMGTVEGRMALVNVVSRTELGWVSASLPAADVPGAAVQTSDTAEWLPDFCFWWPDVSAGCTSEPVCSASASA